MGVNGILKQNFRSIGFIIIQIQSFKKFDSIIFNLLVHQFKARSKLPCVQNLLKMYNFGIYIVITNRIGKYKKK